MIVFKQKSLKYLVTPCSAGLDTIIITCSSTYVLLSFVNNSYISSRDSYARGGMRLSCQMYLYKALTYLWQQTKILFHVKNAYLIFEDGERDVLYTSW